ncbi:RNA polymerase sigma factor SigJ [Actinomycetes bacterium KLBMP 9797]
MRDLAEEFEAERDHLTAVAYRMLGSRAEAEDAVQEAWLRYANALTDPAARAEVRDLRAWLTTAVSRICLDVLRSPRVRREGFPSQWLPEPIVERVPAGPDPADLAARTDQVGMALLVVLEKLTPEQRVAFVLHDVFGVPFENVAEVLGITPVAARQHASRARRAVTDGQPRHTADLAEQRRVLAAFTAATQSGDVNALLSVLAPDVVMIGDGGGVFPAAGRPVSGRDQVATLLKGLSRLADRSMTLVRAAPVLVNGALGMQWEGAYKGRPIRAVMAMTIADGRITAIYNQLSPDKVAAVPPLPSP